MRKLKIGVLEIITTPARNVGDWLADTFQFHQYAGVMPQAIAVWCRNLGHEVHYATYYGTGNLAQLLPHDLDYLFLSCATQNSAIAHVVAKWAQAGGTKVVFGGPHAKSYPYDALKFADLAVKSCNAATVYDILHGDYRPGTILHADRPLDHLPSVRARWPYIRRASYLAGCCSRTAVAPLLTSLGCPNSCNFCVDWNNPYLPLDPDAVEADLRFLLRHKGFVALHDPNLGRNLDGVLAMMRRLDFHTPYVMQCSLQDITTERIQRLQQTGCVLVAPGIESWQGFDAKCNNAGAPKAKQQAVIAQLTELSAAIPYVQANFILGLDCDGDDNNRLSQQLTEEFIVHVPAVWPNINFAVAFGGTPHFRVMQQSQRILPLPFGLYVNPYCSIVTRRSPLELYNNFIRLCDTILDKDGQAARLEAVGHWKGRLAHRFRARWVAKEREEAVEIRGRLVTNANFRDFHEGKHQNVPEFYWQRQFAQLGRYRTALTRSELQPILDQE